MPDLRYDSLDKVSIRSVSSGKYLDGRGPTDSEVYITDRDPKAGDIYLHWHIELMQGGKYAFRSVSSGKYLDGRNSDDAMKDGALLVTDRKPDNDPYLQWTIEKQDGNIVRLRSLSSDLFIDGRDPANGPNTVWLSPGERPASDQYYNWIIETL